jgi:hypothetical protein
MDTDIALNRLESLLHAIAKLYSGIFATVLKERVTSYHAETGNSYDDDIGAALRSYIKQVKQTASTNHPGNSAAISPTGAASDRISASTLNSASEQVNNPLSDYLKKNGAYPELALASPLGEKLKRSAWDHTHSAIRLAHQGDYASAKLHADLANNAVHELGHFMPEADFSAFKAAVKAELHSKS